MDFYRVYDRAGEMAWLGECRDAAHAEEKAHDLGLFYPYKVQRFNVATDEWEEA